MVGVLVIFLLLCTIAMLTAVVSGVARSTKKAVVERRAAAQPPMWKTLRDAENARRDADEARARQVLDAARIVITTQNANGSNFQVPKDSSGRAGELQFESTTPSWQSVSDRLRGSLLCATVTSDQVQPDPYDEIRVTVYYVRTLCLSIRVTRGDYSTTLLLTANRDGDAELHFADKKTSLIYSADRYGWRKLLPELQRRTSPVVDRPSRPALPKQPPPAEMPTPEVGGPLHSARALERSGDAVAARQMYEDIMQNGSVAEQPGATFSLAFMEATAGNTERAVTLYEQVVESGEPGYSRAATNNLKFLGRSD